MSELRYMISDASKKLDVEPHVLRYWEEELEIKIPRNEMGHRYYREQDINTLKHIRELKEKGFGLRAIKMLLPDIENIEQVDVNQLLHMQNTLMEQANKLGDKKEEPKDLVCEEQVKEEKNEETNLMYSMAEEVAVTTERAEIDIADPNNNKVKQFQMLISEVMIETLKENNTELSDLITEQVSERMSIEMDNLLKQKEAREEERFKRFDMNIRELQKTRMELAAAANALPKKKKRFGIF